MILGRWARAGRWLPAPAGKVLDVGAAFGFGTALLAKRTQVTWIAGIERNAAYTREAHRSSPAIPHLRADAGALPALDASVDTVVMLDVLEHVSAGEHALAEAGRVLRDGGWLILSVPHRGPLTVFDSLNVYSRLRTRWPSLPPLDESESSGSGEHRHFSVEELRTMLGSNFTIGRIARTGIGVAELIHLIILVVCRGILQWEQSYKVARFAYFAAYLVEDMIPTGPAAYHLMIMARARRSSTPERLNRSIERHEECC